MSKFCCIIYCSSRSHDGNPKQLEKYKSKIFKNIHEIHKSQLQLQIIAFYRKFKWTPKILFGVTICCLSPPSCRTERLAAPIFSKYNCRLDARARSQNSRNLHFACSSASYLRQTLYFIILFDVLWGTTGITGQHSTVEIEWCGVGVLGGWVGR